MLEIIEHYTPIIFPLVILGLAVLTSLAFYKSGESTARLRKK